MDASKSSWTPYVYYTTLYAIPRYTTYFKRIYLFVYWAGELLEKWGNQSRRLLCKEKS